MFDAKKLLDQFVGSQIPGMSGGNLKDRAGQLGEYARNNPWKAAGLAAAMLGTKTGRKLAGNVASAGGLAAIAGLGYLAYKNYQSGQSPQSVPQPQPATSEPISLPPPDSPFSPQSSHLSNDFALTLVRAMIAAAKADGRIDANEKEAIFERLKAMSLSAEEKAWVFDELSSPLDINAVVARADTPAHAAEIYAASLVAISADTAAEQAYLEALAGKLRLDPALVAEIHRTAGEKLPVPAATPPAPYAYTPSTSNV